MGGGGRSHTSLSLIFLSVHYLSVAMLLPLLKQARLNIFRGHPSKPLDEGQRARPPGIDVETAAVQ